MMTIKTETKETKTVRTNKTKNNKRNTKKTRSHRVTIKSNIVVHVIPQVVETWYNKKADIIRFNKTHTLKSFFDNDAGSITNPAFSR